MKAASWIQPLRAIYAANAAVYASFVVLGVGLAALEPTLAAVVPLVVAAILTSALVVAAIQLRLRPFPWAAGIALLSIASVLLTLLGAALDPEAFRPGWFAFKALFAVCVTLGAVQMWNVREGLQSHVQSLHARVVTGVTSARGRSASDAEMRALLNRARLRAHAWSAIAVIAILGGAWGSFAGLRARATPPEVAPPPTFEDYAARFESTWNSGDAASLSRFWPVDRTDVRTGFLAALELRGWTAERPKTRSSRHSVSMNDDPVHAELEGLDPTRQRPAPHARLTFEIAGGEVTTEWNLIQNAWLLSNIEMPLPLVTEFADEFTARWNAGDMDAIRSMCDMTEVPPLAWNDESPRPSIRDWGERQRNNHEIDVTFASDRGQIVSRCRITRGGVWKVKSLRLP